MERGIPHMGEIIRNMRKQKGYTQDALAQAAGVSVQAVSKWETGQSMPDVALLPSIADFLEVAIDALFGRSVCQANREPAEQAGLSFPHDGRLRVVQYLGDRMMDAQECTDGREIRLYIEDSSQKADIEIQGSARISGAISGAVHASGDLFVDGSISGEVKAGGNITCEGNISGAAQRSNFAANRPAGFDGAAASFKGIKVALSDMGGKLVRIFSTDRTQGNMDAFFRSELPDDEVIRVVQMQGRRIMSVEESSGEQIIRLSVEHLTQNRMNVEVYGSAEIHGNIGGNAHAGETMTCGDVGGNAQAEDSLTCGNVAGNAEAGDGLTCAQVGGSVRAGDSVHVGGDVHGDVSAGESVSCAAIGGNVKADKVRSSVRNASGAESALTSADVEVSSEQADMIRIVRVKNGREIPAEEYEGEKRIRLMLENAEGITVQVQGVALMEGDIQGDVYAYGSLVCEDVEGDVYVQGQSSEAQVRCGAVSGSVTAKNISLTCGDVDGDLNAEAQSADPMVKACGIAGNVTARNVFLSCGDVDGDVIAEGGNKNPTVKVCGVSGNVTARNASLTCGDVDGDVIAEGENKNPTVKACGVAGNVTARNVSLSCGDVDGDVTVEGACTSPSVECGEVSGSVSVRGVSLTCGDVQGDVRVQGGMIRQK